MSFQRVVPQRQEAARCQAKVHRLVCKCVQALVPVYRLSLTLTTLGSSRPERLAVLEYGISLSPPSEGGRLCYPSQYLKFSP